MVCAEGMEESLVTSIWYLVKGPGMRIEDCGIGSECDRMGHCRNDGLRITNHRSRVADREKAQWPKEANSAQGDGPQ